MLGKNVCSEICFTKNVSPSKGAFSVRPINVLVRIKPNDGTLVDGSGQCPMVDCNKNLNSVCPLSLIAANKVGLYVGCNSPCDGLKDPKCCCEGRDCQPDEISLKYKGLCPFTHTYPGDNKPSVYQCKGANSYDITFCLLR
ncbi:Thaumatin protein 1 [Spatholobus suberectus]|nr:Thaumatin protein 1 [Spatholobus suberectus]